MKYLQTFEINMNLRNKNVVKRFKKNMKYLIFGDGEQENYNVDTSADFIIEHCSEWINNPVRLKRSIKTDYEYVFYSKPVKRYSRDNANYYNMILDNAKEWKKYPKRNRSFIGSLDTSPFSDNYYMIPFDGAKIGIVPTRDIFQSFKKGFNGVLNVEYDVDYFFYLIKRVFKKVKINISDTNFTQFKKAIKQFEEGMKTHEFDDLFVNYGPFSSFDENIINKLLEGGDMYENIMKCLDPDINGFKIMNIKEISINDAKINAKNKKLKESDDFEEYRTASKIHNEIWTNSECVFIHTKYIDGVLNSIDKKIKSKTSEIIEK